MFKGILHTEKEDECYHENMGKHKSHTQIYKQMKIRKEPNITKTIKCQELLHAFNNTMNVSGLNCSIKRHRMVDWIKKQDLTICSLQETHVM
jgi:hypothetical protein